MKEKLKSAVGAALEAWLKKDHIEAGNLPEIQLERTKDPAHGDFACNIAMMLAKPLRQAPHKIAEQIVANFSEYPEIARVEIAGPGFINLHLKSDALHQSIRDALEAGEAYGRSNIGAGRRVMLEFVSANPTGPLHVGHGRGAAYGASLASVLGAAGYAVHCEYYVNDAGRQMNILAASIWLRYLALGGESFTFPSNGYKGDYVIEIAQQLRVDHADDLMVSVDELFKNLPPDYDEEAQVGDKEAHIDAIIQRAKAQLGKKFTLILQTGLEAILSDIKEDLAAFGVVFDEWYRETALLHSDALQNTVDKLATSGHFYEKDGARWFRATDYGDEKDRVVERADGTHTYFASDMAYHATKYERGFDEIIYIFGADHHGYVARMNAGIEAMGYDVSCFHILLVQFAILYRGGKRVQMSTRSGSFVTMRELREEVGNDAARFFYVMRKCEQHMDFDMDLAKSRSNENPVYYIQYAHARVCSVLRQAEEKGLVHDPAAGDAALALLTAEEESALCRLIAKYPEIVTAAALQREPHQIANYLRELATAFHVYYNNHRFLAEGDNALCHARLNLILAVRQVIANGLHLLGVSAPDKM